MEKLRDNERYWQDGRRERGKSENVQNDVGRAERTNRIDYDQLLIDAAHLLGVFDTELIYSWTPREFRNFTKGAQLRTIDTYELSAISAIFNAKAKSKKRVKLKDVFDAEKARKELNSPAKSTELNLERYKKAREAMRNYSPIIK